MHRAEKKAEAAEMRRPLALFLSLFDRGAGGRVLVWDRWLLDFGENGGILNGT